MMKFQNVLLACALGAGSLFVAAAPASAAPHDAVGSARPAAAGRLLPGNRTYGGYRGYGYRYGYRYPYRYGVGYRYGYGYPYRYGYGYPYGVSVGIGYGGYGYGGYGVGYGYAPYPAVYGPRAYWVRRPFWHPYRRLYFRRRFVR